MEVTAGLGKSRRRQASSYLAENLILSAGPDRGSRTRCRGKNTEFEHSALGGRE